MNTCLAILFSFVVISVGKSMDEKSVSKRSVLQFKAMMECTLGTSGWKYDGYGCWCVFHGKGKVVDETDACCKVHDDCYKKIKDAKLCEWPHKYSVYYLEYKKKEQCQECAASSEYDNEADAKCLVPLCECDVNAAKCLKDAKFNKANMKYDQKQC